MKPVTASSGVAKVGSPIRDSMASACRIVSAPIQQTSTGLLERFSNSAQSRAMASGGTMAVGAWISSTASAFGSASTGSSAAGYRSGGASPMMSTGLPRDHVGGSTASSAARVSGASAASRPPPATSASVAITPGPPPLLTIASRSPLTPRMRASVSAAPNSSRVVSTRNMPARRNAAS